LNDPPVEFIRDDFFVSTDRHRIDPDRALTLLRTTHWGSGMDTARLIRAIANSITFGVFHGEVLIGLGRIVTDRATYAYWTDVVIDRSYRGRGLGRWLSECMLAHPEVQQLRRVALLTRDARELYAGLGFTEGPGALIYMEHRPG
jgi:GNAT superfamily N-acetyltransferase